MVQDAQHDSDVEQLVAEKVKIVNAEVISLIIPAATKLGQDNVFTGVCDSVNRGGVCLSACWDATPQQQTPREQTPPWSRHPPGADTHPPGADTPPGLSTPLPGTKYTPQIFLIFFLIYFCPPPIPRKQTLAYGQRAAGTHPTGMHSC